MALYSAGNGVPIQRAAVYPEYLAGLGNGVELSGFDNWFFHDLLFLWAPRVTVVKLLANISIKRENANIYRKKT